MTPLMNGRSILIATEERRALTRVRVDRVESKIDMVAVAGGAGWDGIGRLCEGEGVSDRSGYVMDGKEDVTEE